MLQLLVFALFFFSSRRRHTRSLCDWSSDVCSSDLRPAVAGSFAPPRCPMDSCSWPSEWGQGRSPGFGRRHPSLGIRGSRRSEEHTSELQSHSDLVCRLLLEKKKKQE